MCNASNLTCTICGRELIALWKTCGFVPSFALSNRVDKSISENDLTAPHAAQPAACRYKEVAKDSYICNICQLNEEKSEEKSEKKRKNSIVRLVTVSIVDALKKITNKDKKNYDKTDDKAQIRDELLIPLSSSGSILQPGYDGPCMLI